MISATLALAAVLAALSLGVLIGHAAGWKRRGDAMSPKYRRVGSPE